MRLSTLAGHTLFASLAVAGPSIAEEVETHPLKEAYFGDLHLHTAFSLDAFLTNTRTLPDDAYRYAKGEPIPHVSGETIRISRPLDFLAVTDHAVVLGVAWAMTDPESPLAQLPVAQSVTSLDYETSHVAFRTATASAAAGLGGVLADLPEAKAAVRSTWQEIVEAAQRHYEPGRFTTFVAYEWTSMPDLANLHRNVIFRGERAPEVPFSSVDSTRPEDLWSYLEAWRAQGGEVLAIPHNSNASKGLMFPLVDADDELLDADYADRRMLNEPIVEITQMKGTSETHPALAPTDELAGFELWERVVGATDRVEPVPGSYVRSAYGRGLLLEATQGRNPYRFGLIGSSDSHNSSTAVEEANFTGGHGNADMTPELRLRGRPSTLTESSVEFSASGLAGVWAESNTREAIFDALARKETFATSGPRIRVRFFAGAGFAHDLAEQSNAVERAYAGGVPMGGDLQLVTGEKPAFFARAARDPKTTGLERIQIVKGWLEEGESRERVLDVACAQGSPDPETGRCPETGATVDLETCEPRNEGAAELSVVWRDDDYDDAGPAFYYVRVIQHPTCRWSTWDALRLGIEPPTERSPTLRERAWSSPIWVSTAG